MASRFKATEYLNQNLLDNNDFLIKAKGKTYIKYDAIEIYPSEHGMTINFSYRGNIVLTLSEPHYSFGDSVTAQGLEGVVPFEIK